MDSNVAPVLGAMTNTNLSRQGATVIEPQQEIESDTDSFNTVFINLKDLSEKILEKTVDTPELAVPDEMPSATPDKTSATPDNNSQPTTVEVEAEVPSEVRDPDALVIRVETSRTVPVGANPPVPHQEVPSKGLVDKPLPQAEPAPTTPTKERETPAQSALLGQQTKETLSEIAVNGRSLTAPTQITQPVVSQEYSSPPVPRAMPPLLQSSSPTGPPPPEPHDVEVGKSSDKAEKVTGGAQNSAADVPRNVPILTAGKQERPILEAGKVHQKPDVGVQLLRNAPSENTHIPFTRGSTDQAGPSVRPLMPTSAPHVLAKPETPVNAVFGLLKEASILDDKGLTTSLETSPRQGLTPVSTTPYLSQGQQTPPEARAVAMQMASQFASQTNKTTVIRLDPEELGHVRMTLRSTETGLTMVIVAERPETSEMMRRSIHELAEEFRSLGYESMAFQFGEPPPDQQQNQRQGTFSAHAEPDVEMPLEKPTTGQTDGRLNIRL